MCLRKERVNLKTTILQSLWNRKIEKWLDKIWEDLKSQLISPIHPLIFTKEFSQLLGRSMEDNHLHFGSWAFPGIDLTIGELFQRKMRGAPGTWEREGCRRRCRAWNDPGVSMVCCRASPGCGGATELWRNHGKDIFRRAFWAIVSDFSNGEVISGKGWFTLVDSQDDDIQFLRPSFFVLSHTPGLFTISLLFSWLIPEDDSQSLS